MSEHGKLVPGDYLDDPEIRAGYDEARRAIELGATARSPRVDAELSGRESGSPGTPDPLSHSGSDAVHQAADGLIALSEEMGLYE